MFIKGTPKRLGVALALCLALIFALSGPVLAVDQKLHDDFAVASINPSIRFTYINIISTSMYTAANGITSTGYIQAYPDLVDSIRIFLYLEQYDNGQWVTVRSWSKYVENFYAYLEGFSTAPTGHYYRVRGSYYAWSGSNYEHVTGYSGTKYY